MNIVVFRLRADGPDAGSLVARARDLGVLVVAFRPNRIRVVTHLDVTTDACRLAAGRLLGAIAAGARKGRADGP